ncbi:MAG: FAD-dependent oxidoreductase [Pigmentiphaga sp.]|nr:FAD-dependent oxidoreductase [Pigmentiphaga sp.]
MKRTISIIGANVAGVAAAETLRSEGFDGRIVLLSNEPTLPYERPPLSKEGLNPGSSGPVPLQDEAFYSLQDIELRTNTSVMSIDCSRRRLIQIDGSELPTDQVILCTGASVRRLNVPGAALEGVCYLRTYDDAVLLADYLGRVEHVVIVGMGIIGAEVAAKARALGCRVTAIEASGWPLSRALGRIAGELLINHHLKRGLALRLNTCVSRFVGEDGRVRAVETTEGERLPADLVLVGVGVIPNDVVARQAGVAVDNGVVIDGLCRTSVPDVYAAGDVANQVDFFGQRQRHENVACAREQGVMAARAILGMNVDCRPIPASWTDQFDMNIQVLGRISEGTVIARRGEVESGQFSLFYLRGGILEGAVSVNSPRVASGARQLIASGWRGDAGLLSDEAVDLRRLRA